MERRGGGGQAGGKSDLLLNWFMHFFPCRCFVLFHAVVSSLLLELREDLGLARFLGVEALLVEE
jgi:hypothetical protein